LNARRWFLVGLTTTLVGVVGALAALRSSEPVLEPGRESGENSEPLPGLTASVVAQIHDAAPTDRSAIAAPPAEMRPAERGPVLVAGRLVDDLGNPVEPEEMLAMPAPAGADAPAKMNAAIWMRGDLPVTGGSPVAPVYLGGGRFEARGWTEADQIRMRFRVGTRPTQHDFAVGSRDAVVVFPRVGSVRVVMLHDRGINPRWFELSLRQRIDSPPIPLEVGRAERPGERHFVKLPVPVGTYALEVRLWGNPETLLVLEGIKVLTGQECPDPRLKRLDVRGQCRSVTATFLQPDGQPLGTPACFDAEVTALDPNGDPLPLQPKLRKSRVELVTRHGYVDLTVCVKHYREVHLPLLRQDCTVRLKPSDREKKDGR
jgi:hypothetical protein